MSRCQCSAGARGGQPHSSRWPAASGDYLLHRRPPRLAGRGGQPRGGGSRDDQLCSCGAAERLPPGVQKSETQKGSQASPLLCCCDGAVRRGECACLTCAHSVLHQVVDRTKPGSAGAQVYAASSTATVGVQVYTAGGRQLLAPVQLGGRPAFLAAADPWRLLAVAAGGALWVWDLAALRVEVQGSAAPLLALAPARGGHLLRPKPSDTMPDLASSACCRVNDCAAAWDSRAWQAPWTCMSAPCAAFRSQPLLLCVRPAVTGMRLSAAGLPLAVLSNGTAHAYHAGMAAWMRVADALFPTSAFHSVLRMSSGMLPSSVHGFGSMVFMTSVGSFGTLLSG